MRDITIKECAMVKFFFTLLCIILLQAHAAVLAQESTKETVQESKTEATKESKAEAANKATAKALRIAAHKKASEFFKNMSKEKNLIEALYNKHRDKKTNTPLRKAFTLAGEAGLLSTSGNTDTSIVKLALESNHEMTNWSNRYELQFLRKTDIIRNKDRSSGTQNGQIETTRVEVSAQFDYKLVQPNNRLFGYLEYDDNQFNRLRDQATVVMGWSHVLWKEENSEFRYSIGPGYSHLRQTRDNTTIKEMIVRGTMFYNLKLGKNARFRQTLSVERGEEITKAKSQSSITAKVFEKLAMKLSINLVFNDNVAIQDSSLSTQTSLSMVYQFF
jgi:putative salt-induced outer membrane protein